MFHFSIGSVSEVSNCVRDAASLHMFGCSFAFKGYRGGGVDDACLECVCQ